MTWRSISISLATSHTKETLAEHEYAYDVITALCILLFPMLGLAQTDEIQVYDGAIAPPGVFNLMIHQNFTPKGRTIAEYPGAIVANHSCQVTAEFAHGVSLGWNKDFTPSKLAIFDQLWFYT